MDEAAEGEAQAIDVNAGRTANKKPGKCRAFCWRCSLSEIRRTRRRLAQCFVGAGVEAGAAGLAEVAVGAGTDVDSTESVPLPP